MVIEVVLGEVGEHGSREAAASHTLLRQGVGTHFHRRQAAAGGGRLGKLPLQEIGKGRGVGGRDAVARPAVHQRAEQTHRLASRSGQMLDQMGGGGFAIGAGHTNQGHAPAGMVPVRRCNLTDSTRHRILDHHHRVISTWRLCSSSFSSNYGSGGTGLKGLSPKRASIHPFAGKSEKQGSRADAAGIGGDRLQSRIHQPRRHCDACITQKGMQRLRHPISPLLGGVLRRSERRGQTALQPIQQSLTREPRGNPGKLRPIEREHRHLKVVARLQLLGGAGRIDIDHGQLDREPQEIELAQAGFQAFAEAATGTAEEGELLHQSGTGSQPQGVKGWQRSSRFTVSQPPFHGPCFWMASRP